MHIFIDESGNFVRSKHRNDSVSTVGALVVPDKKMADLDKLYGRLRTSLPKEKGEVKGKLLNESEVQKVCKILKMLGCIFNVVATDVNSQSENEVADHMAEQVTLLTANITAQHNPNLVRDVEKLKLQLEKMSPQLYIQSIGLTTLVYDVFQKCSLYFALRSPKELGQYHWIIDGKGRDGNTNWENWWSSVIMAFLESSALKKPFVVADSGDYSAHDRFLKKPSEYKSQVLGLNKDKRHLELNMIIKEDFRFSSNPEFGLELVDILTNTIRRSMRGNFKKSGWKNLRELMIDFQSSHYVKMYTLGKSTNPPADAPYLDFLNYFTTGGKQILRPSDMNELSSPIITK